MTLSACLFFAMASALVYHLHDRFPTVQIIFIQNIISLACTLPLSLRNGIHQLKTYELPTHFLRDLTGVASYFLFFLSIRNLSLVDATTLNYTSPFYIPLIWMIWQKEKIQRAVWWSIIIGFLGIAVILNPSRDIFRFGFIYGVFGAILSATAMTALRVLNIRKEPMSRTLFYYFSFGALISSPFAWAVWVPPNPSEWIFVSGIGVATAVAQILITLAYQYGTASFLAPISYITVVYNSLIAWYVFDLHLSGRSIAGGLLIIFGGVMTYLFKKRPSIEQESQENKGLPPISKRPFNDEVQQVDKINDI
jgi:drug/metabolite transporter (DMT)-like permease